MKMKIQLQWIEHGDSDIVLIEYIYFDLICP